MSAGTLGRDGLAALDEGRYESAISVLSAALTCSSSPLWLNGRSRALVATGRFPEALADAESAYHLALNRGSRDLIQDAQYRRAVALYRLGQHADADACLSWVMAACSGGKLSDADEAVGGVDAEGRYTVRKIDVERMLREKREAAEKKKTAEGLMGGMMGGAKETPAAKLFNMAGALRLSILHAMEASPSGAPGWKRQARLVPPKKGDRPPELNPVPYRPVPVAPKFLRADAYESEAKQTITIFVKNVPAEAFRLEWISDSTVHQPTSPIPPFRNTFD